MRVSKICRIAVGLALISVIAGCDTVPPAHQPDLGPPVDGGAGDLGSAHPDGSTGGATFQNVQAQVLDYCSCHGSGGGTPFAGGSGGGVGGLDLSPANAWASLVNVPATIAPSKLRVVPGDPAHSFLYQKLTGNMPADGSEGQPMPELRAKPTHPATPALLPDAQLQLVHDWIAAGALND